MQDPFESHGIHVPFRLHQHHQRQDNNDKEREVEVEYVVRGYVKNKSMPLSILIEILKLKAGKDDIDVGKLRSTLVDMFCEYASPMERLHL
ncbi:hypothetical protein ACOSP7_028700 [Xanthoceras sorbifolium]